MHLGTYPGIRNGGWGRRLSGGLVAEPPALGVRFFQQKKCVFRHIWA